MTNFWLIFVINEAMGVLAAYIASTASLSDAQKAAAEKLAADGTAFLDLL